MLVLPSPKSPFEKHKVTLDGVDYILTYAWNMRLGWTLGISDADGNVISRPKRLVPNWDMTYTLTNAVRPRGVLLCYDSQTPAEPPTFDSIGVRHKMVYITEEETEE